MIASIRAELSCGCTRIIASSNFSSYHTERLRLPRNTVIFNEKKIYENYYLCHKCCPTTRCRHIFHHPVLFLKSLLDLRQVAILLCVGI